MLHRYFENLTVLTTCCCNTCCSCWMRHGATALTGARTDIDEVVTLDPWTTKHAMPPSCSPCRRHHHNTSGNASIVHGHRARSTCGASPQKTPIGRSSNRHSTAAVSSFAACQSSSQAPRLLCVPCPRHCTRKSAKPFDSCTTSSLMSQPTQFLSNTHAQSLRHIRQIRAYA